MPSKKIKLAGKDEAISILGIQDGNLRRMERELGVEMFVRHEQEGGGIELTLRGSTSRVDKAARVIKTMLGAKNPKENQGGKESRTPLTDGLIFQPGHAGGIKPRGERQKLYVESIFSHDLVLAVGPAGTGKTYLAVAAALRAMELQLVSRIILTRPIVEAGEKLGFLPGDLYDKVHPYLRPLYDAFYTMLGPEKFRYYREDEVIEILPLAYMRGRTLESAFIILDEAQNTMPEQMKMFLTRMGMNSKMVITGDITQIDLKDKRQCGLIEALHILRGVEGVKVMEFEREDVVRHPLVKDILKAYEAWEENPDRGPAKNNLCE